MGTYTDIVAIVAPAEALAGELVNVEARVQNLAGYAIYISTSGKFDNTIFNLYPEYATVGAGVTHSFSGSFTMPNKGVRVYVWSYYWNGEQWRVDDEAYVDIALKELVPEFSGFGLTEYTRV
ncbi:hypothetical protein ES707_03661 [subsurface metagenome]